MSGRQALPPLMPTYFRGWDLSYTQIHSNVFAGYGGGGVGKRGAQGKAERGSCFHGILPRGGHVEPQCQSPCGEITNASMGSLVTHPRGPDSSQKTQIQLKRRQHSKRASSPPSQRHTPACKSGAAGQLLKYQSWTDSPGDVLSPVVNPIEIPTL